MRVRLFLLSVAAAGLGVLVVPSQALAWYSCSTGYPGYRYAHARGDAATSQTGFTSTTSFDHFNVYGNNDHSLAGWTVQSSDGSYFLELGVGRGAIIDGFHSEVVTFYRKKTPTSDVMAIVGRFIASPVSFSITRQTGTNIFTGRINGTTVVSNFAIPNYKYITGFGEDANFTDPQCDDFDAYFSTNVTANNAWALQESPYTMCYYNPSTRSAWEVWMGDYLPPTWITSCSFAFTASPYGPENAPVTPLPLPARR